MGEEDNVFEIERILQSTIDKGVRWYWIRWKGFGPDEDTWEPEENLIDCKNVLEKYWKDCEKHKQNKTGKGKSGSTQQTSKTAKKKRKGRTTNNSTVVRIDSGLVKDKQLIFTKSNGKNTSIKHDSQNELLKKSDKIHLDDKHTNVAQERKSASSKQGNKTRRKKYKKGRAQGSLNVVDVQAKPCLDENETSEGVNKSLESFTLPNKTTAGNSKDENISNPATSEQIAVKVSLEHQKSQENLSKNQSWSTLSPEYVPEYCDETLPYDNGNEEEEFEYFNRTGYFVKDSIGYNKTSKRDPVNSQQIDEEEFVLKVSDDELGQDNFESSNVGHENSLASCRNSDEKPGKTSCTYEDISPVETECLSPVFDLPESMKAGLQFQCKMDDGDMSETLKAQNADTSKCADHKTFVEKEESLLKDKRKTNSFQSCQVENMKDKEESDCEQVANAVNEVNYPKARPSSVDNNSTEKFPIEVNETQVKSCQEKKHKYRQHSEVDLDKSENVVKGVNNYFEKSPMKLSENKKNKPRLRLSLKRKSSDGSNENFGKKYKLPPVSDDELLKCDSRNEKKDDVDCLETPNNVSDVTEMADNKTENSHVLSCDESAINIKVVDSSTIKDCGCQSQVMKEKVRGGLVRTDSKQDIVVPIKNGRKSLLKDLDDSEVKECISGPTSDETANVFSTREEKVSDNLTNNKAISFVADSQVKENNFAVTSIIKPSSPTDVFREKSFESNLSITQAKDINEPVGSKEKSSTPSLSPVRSSELLISTSEGFLNCSTSDHSVKKGLLVDLSRTERDEQKTSIPLSFTEKNNTHMPESTSAIPPLTKMTWCNSSLQAISTSSVAVEKKSSSPTELSVVVHTTAESSGTLEQTLSASSHNKQILTTNVHSKQGHDSVSWSSKTSKTYPYSTGHSSLPVKNINHKPDHYTSVNQQASQASYLTSNFIAEPFANSVPSITNHQPFLALAGVNWYPNIRNSHLTYIRRPQYYVPAFPPHKPYSQQQLQGNFYAKTLQEIARRNQPGSVSTKNKEYTVPIDADKAWYVNHVGSAKLFEDKNDNSTQKSLVKDIPSKKILDKNETNSTLSNRNDNIAGSQGMSEATSHKTIQESKVKDVSKTLKFGGIPSSSKKGSDLESRNSPNNVEKAESAQQHLVKQKITRSVADNEGLAKAKRASSSMDEKLHQSGNHFSGSDKNKLYSEVKEKDTNLVVKRQETIVKSKPGATTQSTDRVKEVKVKSTATNCKKPSEVIVGRTSSSHSTDISGVNSDSKTKENSKDTCISNCKEKSSPIRVESSSKPKETKSLNSRSIEKIDHKPLSKSYSREKDREKEKTVFIKDQEKKRNDFKKTHGKDKNFLSKKDDLLKSRSKGDERHAKQLSQKNVKDFKKQDSVDSEIAFDMDDYSPEVVEDEKLEKDYKIVPQSGIPTALSFRDMKTAIKHGDSATVLASLAGGMGIDSRDSVTGMSLLMRAVSFGQENIVKLLLNHGANVSMKDATGSTPLIEACEQGFGNIVSLLLNSEIDINAKQTLSGETALIKACMKGHYSIVAMLLAHGADCQMRSVSGLTAAQLAVQCGNFEIRDLLESQSKKLQDWVEKAIVKCLCDSSKLIYPPLLPFVSLYPAEGQKFTYHFHCSDPLLSKTILLFCLRAVFSRSGKVDLSFYKDNGVHTVLLNGALQSPVLMNNKSVFVLKPKLDTNRLILQTYQSHVHLLVCIYATDTDKNILNTEAGPT